MDLDCNTSVSNSHCHSNLLSLQKQIDSSHLSNNLSSSPLKVKETMTSTLIPSPEENSSSSPSSTLFITSSHCSCLLGYYALNISTCLRSKSIDNYCLDLTSCCVWSLPACRGQHLFKISFERVELDFNSPYLFLGTSCIVLLCQRSSD